MWKLKIADGGGDGGERWLTTTNNHVGRQRWEFDADGGTPEERAQVEEFRQEFKKNRFRFRQSADLFMRMQLRKENGSCGEIARGIKVEEREEIREEAIMTTLKRGISFYSTIQAHDGHWPAESAGALFFLPPLVMELYITGDLDNVLSMEHKREILRYTYNHQNEDGGWGFHVEGHSTMFGSILNYAALRLLGEDADERAVARARKWILDHGGAVKIPSWGKFWLTVLGVHEWEGCNPVPPEIWLFPSHFPINPGIMFCYARLVYMSMSYLYGKRFVGPKTKLVLSLRQELYTQPYDKINWNKARKSCAKEDLYYPHPLIQDVLWEFLHNFVEPFLTRWPFSKLREKAMKVAMELVHYEDENSRYFSLACIEKEFSLLACWVECPNSEAYKRHLARIPDFFWIAEDGMKMQTFGSQTWDTSFAIQALLCSNLVQEYGPTLRKAHNFLKASQIRDNPSGDFRKMYRHISKGGWTFSMQDQGWQVSDCTAEALKAVLLCSQMPQELVGEEIETEQLYDAVNVILYLQSASGGFPGWEPKRVPRWLEKFNPMEFFEDALIERDYVECTSSAIQGLALFMKLHPEYRQKEIEECISKAVQYIENTQEPDGSWYGCWGICYTYGTWFAVKGLVDCGKNCKNSDIVRKGCEFLVSKQLDDGGWGESYLSSSNKVYTNLEGNISNLVQTSWALLALIDAGQAEIDPSPIQRGIRLLINSQMEDGNFPQQNITGIAMKNLILNYASYRNIFPIWALAEYRLCLLRP